MTIKHSAEKNAHLLYVPRFLFYAFVTEQEFSNEYRKLDNQLPN